MSERWSDRTKQPSYINESWRLFGRLLLASIVTLVNGNLVLHLLNKPAQPRELDSHMDNSTGTEYLDVVLTDSLESYSREIVRFPPYFVSTQANEPSSNGQKLALIYHGPNWKDTLHIYSSGENEPLTFGPLTPGFRDAIEWSPAGNYLAMSVLLSGDGRDYGLMVFDVTSDQAWQQGPEVITSPLGAADPTWFAWSPTGEYLAWSEGTDIRIKVMPEKLPMRPEFKPVAKSLLTWIDEHQVVFVDYRTSGPSTIGNLYLYDIRTQESTLIKELEGTEWIPQLNNVIFVLGSAEGKWVGLGTTHNTNFEFGIFDFAGNLIGTSSLPVLPLGPLGDHYVLQKIICEPNKLTGIYSNGELRAAEIIFH
ncbi:MAG TPA: hypothetical protein VD999_01755 [Vitreimonas sp.]|nr:hypothetical protein [Vitreimonas sp.]